MEGLEKFGNCYEQHFTWAFFRAQCAQKRGCDCGLRTNPDTVVLGLGYRVQGDPPLLGLTVQGLFISIFIYFYIIYI